LRQPKQYSCPPTEMLSRSDLSGQEARFMQNIITANSMEKITPFLWLDLKKLEIAAK
jgi:hypothetical protein